MSDHYSADTGCCPDWRAGSAKLNAALVCCLTSYLADLQCDYQSAAREFAHVRLQPKLEEVTAPIYIKTSKNLLQAETSASIYETPSSH